MELKDKALLSEDRRSGKMFGGHIPKPLYARWEALNEGRPIAKTRYLVAALTYYVEAGERYGLDQASLAPLMPYWPEPSKPKKRVATGKNLGDMLVVLRSESDHEFEENQPLNHPPNK